MTLNRRDADLGPGAAVLRAIDRRILLTCSITDVGILTLISNAIQSHW